MKDYIHMYPNEFGGNFNESILRRNQDRSIIDFIIMEMEEILAVKNYKILDIQVVENEDEVDICKHSVNINYKKKDMSSIEIPKFRFLTEGCYGEVIFTIEVKTNTNCKVITKPILFPIEHDGFYYNNGKQMKAIWQLVDESTYSQRGKITLKSRMPVVIYQNRNRILEDVLGETHQLTGYSYALNGRPRAGGKKPKAKYINPLMIYAAKMGLSKTIEFFGMQGIVNLTTGYKNSELEDNYIFPLDELYITVDKVLYDKFELVRTFVCMLYNLRVNRDFPLTWDLIDDVEYWTCRMGTIGAARNKNILSFYDKGKMTILMIERLLNNVTQESLRLPQHYKQDIYYLIYWMICNFEELRKYSNTDMRSKRIRCNEYIVNSSLGKKISENLAKVIERKSKSKMNTMDTLLEMFNFGSDIVVSGMRKLNDLIKTDDIVNDMSALQDISYSSKGYQTLGDGNSKKIPVKYRQLDPSFIGKVDMNVSSNSDIGMTGAIVPFTELYDGFFFNEDRQPCTNRYEFEKACIESGAVKRPGIKIDSFDEYLESLQSTYNFESLLVPEVIEIVEKVVDTET